VQETGQRKATLSSLTLSLFPFVYSCTHSTKHLFCAQPCARQGVSTKSRRPWRVLRACRPVWERNLLQTGLVWLRLQPRALSQPPLLPRVSNWSSFWLTGH
jgi:hypothetical protein